MIERKNSRFLQEHFRGKLSDFSITYRMLHKDDSIRWIQCSGRIMERDRFGNPKKMFGVHIDVTEQYIIKEQLVINEENFRTFFETMDDIILVGTIEGKVIYANNATYDKLWAIHPRILRICTYWICIRKN